MTKRIGASVVTLLAAGAVGLTSSTSAQSSPAGDITRVQCAWACPDIYQPVTCEMSDGRVMTFANRCYASLYACKHGLKIISCRPAGD